MSSPYLPSSPPPFCHAFPQFSSLPSGSETAFRDHEAPLPAQQVPRLPTPPLYSSCPPRPPSYLCVPFYVTSSRFPSPFRSSPSLCFFPSLLLLPYSASLAVYSLRIRFRTRLRHLSSSTLSR
eukprot:754428-Hanusia_phi.AAC.4